MKKFLFLPAALLALAMLAGCEVEYYHTESSEDSIPAYSAEDSVPAYVFGENGFYDSVNDVEFLRADGVYAKKGDAYFTFDGRTMYKVEGEHESYLLCDENGSVFKNRDLPWRAELGDADWAEEYPTLSTEPFGEENGSDSSAG